MLRKLENNNKKEKMENQKNPYKQVTNPVTITVTITI
jgi:hypothetical protein